MVEFHGQPISAVIVLWKLNCPILIFDGLYCALHSLTRQGVGISFFQARKRKTTGSLVCAQNREVRKLNNFTEQGFAS